MIYLKSVQEVCLENIFSFMMRFVCRPVLLDEISERILIENLLNSFTAKLVDLKRY